MPEIPEPTAWPLKFRVSCLPPDNPENRHFGITVELQGDGRWAILDGPYDYLGADGTWSWKYSWRDNQEPETDEELAADLVAYDAWWEDHLFDLEKAILLAKKAVPHITVNGFTVARYLEWVAEIDEQKPSP